MRSGKQSRLLLSAVVAGLGAWAPAAFAVVTIGGTGYNSGAAPGNVGEYEGIFDNGYTGTPISSNMMVTAAHVFPGPTSTFVYDNGTTTDTTYTVQAVATLDDLAVWEITPNQAATFANPAPIYTGSGELGSSIVDVGRGYQRGSPINGGWGYGGGQGPLSWGDNTISAVDTNSQLGLSGSMGGNFLQFDFNSATSDPNTCMLTPFDSGGGLFIDVNGQYQLAGINSFTGVRIPTSNGDPVSSVSNSTGAAVQGTLYNTNGYYCTGSGWTTQQITTNTPMSSFATQISSKQNFIGEADGSISSGAATSLPINDDGTLVVYSNMTAGNITGDGTVEVGNGTNATLQIAPNSGTSEVAGLSISAGSSLDITNNRILIDGGTNPWTEAWILKCLTTGFNGGQWDGPGIDSSTAAANSGHYGVGFADSNDPGVPGLASGQAEIAYALYGDCNMDGTVNGEDFLIMATHFDQLAPQGWEDGDFNYDGIVNSSDFVLYSENLNKSSTAVWNALDAFAAANDFSLNTTVPEPTGFIPLAAVSLFILARRTRNQRPIPVNC